MQIKTILNRIQKQRGFVYGPMQLVKEADGLALHIEIYPHARNRPRCSGCGRRGGHYDTLGLRQFEFVPLWGLRVFFLYLMRRVHCRTAAIDRDAPGADRRARHTTGSRRAGSSSTPSGACASSFST